MTQKKSRFFVFVFFFYVLPKLIIYVVTVMLRLLLNYWLFSFKPEILMIARIRNASKVVIMKKKSYDRL